MYIYICIYIYIYIYMHYTHLYTGVSKTAPPAELSLVLESWRHMVLVHLWHASQMLSCDSQQSKERSGTGNGGYEMVANHPILKNLNRTTVNHSMQFWPIANMTHAIEILKPVDIFGSTSLLRPMQHNGMANSAAHSGDSPCSPRTARCSAPWQWGLLGLTDQDQGPLSSSKFDEKIEGWNFTGVGAGVGATLQYSPWCECFADNYKDFGTCGEHSWWSCSCCPGHTCKWRAEVTRKFRGGHHGPCHCCDHHHSCGASSCRMWHSWCGPKLQSALPCRITEVAWAGWGGLLPAMLQEDCCKGWLSQSITSPDLADLADWMFLYNPPWLAISQYPFTLFDMTSGCNAMLRPPVVLSVDTLVWVQSGMRSAMRSAVFCLSNAFATVLPTFINMQI